MKQFTTAARRGASPVPNPVPIEFQWDDYTLTAQPPTAGQLALFVASQSGGFTLDSVTSLFDLLAQILSEDDFGVIRSALEDGVDIEMVMEVVQYLITEWSARPTTPPAASSRSRRTTGRSSTAKRVPAASTSGRSPGTAG